MEHHPCRLRRRAREQVRMETFRKCMHALSSRYISNPHPSPGSSSSNPSFNSRAAPMVKTSPLASPTPLWALTPGPAKSRITATVNRSSPRKMGTSPSSSGKIPPMLDAPSSTAIATPSRGTSSSANTVRAGMSKASLAGMWESRDRRPMGPQEWVALPRWGDRGLRGRVRWLRWRWLTFWCWACFGEGGHLMCVQ